jgi:hypothetical protein
MESTHVREAGEGLRSRNTSRKGNYRDVGNRLLISKTPHNRRLSLSKI